MSNTGLTITAVKRLACVMDQFSPAERQFPTQHFEGKLKKKTAILKNRRNNTEKFIEIF